MSAACPVFGFVVEVDVANRLTDDHQQSLRRALHDDVLEPRGLTCVDRFAGQQWSFTVRSEASQATHADREAVESWADARREIAAIRVGPLLDLASAA
jgi:uncharacterized protein YggL (DUF469 family)